MMTSLRFLSAALLASLVLSGREVKSFPKENPKAPCNVCPSTFEAAVPQKAVMMTPGQSGLSPDCCRIFWVHDATTLITVLLPAPAPQCTIIKGAVGEGF